MAIKPAFVPQAQAMLAAVENLADVPQDRVSENGYEYLPDIKTAIVAINGVLGHKLSAAQKAY